MTTRRYLSQALLLACVITCAGCASGSGWFGGGQANTLGNPTTPSLAQPSKPSLLGSISDALTIKPKVIPADDPLTVNGKQGRVGAEVYLSAARLYENQGEFEAAAGQYRKALEASPKSLPALLGYARLQDRENKFDEATRLYKKAISAYPQSATAYNDLGLCQARHKQPEAALESVQKAVQLEPTNKLYRNNAASVLVDMGRSTEAFEHLVLAHGEAVAHYNLGFLLYQRDKKEFASQQFALAVEKDPSLAPARDMLNRLGGVAERETVQRTQHLVEAPGQKSTLPKHTAAPIQVSPAFATPPESSAPAAPAKRVPARVPSAQLKTPALGKVAAPAAESTEPARAQAVAPASLPAVEAPRHIFPPIRLPEAAEPPEDERAGPAPLPDGETFPPGQELRKFPSSDGEE